MNFSQLHQIAHYMEDRGRMVRMTPVTGLPHAERYSQTERLIDSLWDFSRELGLNLGARPTIILTGDAIAPAPALLARLTVLHAEVLATFVMCGILSAESRALREFTCTPPGKPTPNFRTIIDEEYNPTDAETVERE
jgi:hypothetical protein